MILKRIIGNGVSGSRRGGKKYAEQWDGRCWLSSGRCWYSGVMRWCVSTRITFWGVILCDLAETRDFYSADFHSGAGSLPEPVLFLARDA